ncbi:MAG: glycosyltransferase family 4 protein [Calditerrivibrio sp.]|nr:glycosyltransferase family 4 protein [Calditerrivibrio sp.]MCA1932549.1 glycosyltransferase family 4 protein [Calditerrivibrio sp.]MCA1980061.1 glycosyltransferase family 4 protein [Calditerrivibrio sp.]
MNIAFITDSDKLSGGVKQLYYNMLGLKERKNNIFLVCKKNADIEEISKNYVTESMNIDFSKKLKSGIRVADKFREWNIDIIHSFHNKGHKLAVISKIFYGKPKLFVNRGVTFLPHNLLFYHNPLVDGFIVNSSSVKKVLKSILIPDRKISVIYNAYDPSDNNFHNKSEIVIDESKVNICAIVSDSKWKAPDNIFKTFNKLKYKDLAFHIIGDIDKTKYAGLIDNDQMDKFVFWGKRKDVPDILKKMDIFVHLPRSGDSLPNIIIEAFDASLPIVASDVGGISEIVVDTKGGFIVKSISNAVEKISLLINDKNKRGYMGKFNSNLVKHFSLNKKIDLLLECYNGKNIVQNIYSE